MINEHPIRTRYQAVRPLLDERGRRLHVAAEAISAGYGGVAAASRATKVARSTIGRGIKDLLEPGSLTGKVRRKGAGRPTATAKDATLLGDLERLLEAATMGDPMRPLRWVSKSHQKLATALCVMGHQVSASTIPKLLERLEYRRHVNRKTKDGGQHPDREGRQRRAALAVGEPGRHVRGEVDLAQLLRDRLGRQEVGLDEAAEIVGDAFVVARNDGGMRDRQAERPAE